MSERVCEDCGTTANLTKHSLAGNHKAPFVILCQKCHNDREGRKPCRTPKAQADRLLRRSSRFVERSLKLIRQDRRWVHIADQWTEAEKKEMLEYLHQYQFVESEISGKLDKKLNRIA